VTRSTPRKGAEETDEIRRLAAVAAAAASAKQAHDTVVLDVSGVLVITDLFVVTSAANTRQVKAVVEEIERRAKLDCGAAPLHVEGFDELQWVLMDYGDVVVHVFLDEVRRVYDLERLWSDVPRLPVEPAPLAAAAGADPPPPRGAAR
jgi:ribosome-associated protein